MRAHHRSPREGKRRDVVAHGTGPHAPAPDDDTPPIPGDDDTLRILAVPAEPSAVLRLTNATKAFPGGVTALDDVSLTIHEGELLAIVGPSGSGKSTLLIIMGTLDLPTRGTVEIAGQDAASLSDRRLSALRGRWLGFVFPQFPLTEGLTAAENVATSLRGGAAQTAHPARARRAGTGRARPPGRPAPGAGPLADRASAPATERVDGRRNPSAQPPTLPPDQSGEQNSGISWAVSSRLKRGYAVRSIDVSGRSDAMQQRVDDDVRRLGGAELRHLPRHEVHQLWQQRARPPFRQAGA